MFCRIFVEKKLNQSKRKKKDSGKKWMEHRTLQKWRVGLKFGCSCVLWLLLLPRRTHHSLGQKPKHKRPRFIHLSEGLLINACLNFPKKFPKWKVSFFIDGERFLINETDWQGKAFIRIAHLIVNCQSVEQLRTLIETKTLNWRWKIQR